ncbi:MAG: hypothetical protein GY820_15070 [Gammaproteobacteria bacterium]|nr:hypothetical protein [Gammaproteobacteria bacterium]
MPLDFDCCWEKTKFIPISQNSMVHIDEIEVNASFKSHRFDLLVTTGSYSILIDLLYKGKSTASLPASELATDNPGIMALDCDSFSIAALKADRTKRFSVAVTDFVLKKGHVHGVFIRVSRLCCRLLAINIANVILIFSHAKNLASLLAIEMAPTSCTIIRLVEPYIRIDLNCVG